VIDDALKDDPVPPPSSGAPHSLSPRELDVLRLIVEGKSDREIAEELFISHHTVSRHVSNILGKMGVESRTAAAATAVRDGLR
jgi:DNA-binding NarL/FixJ family response regulator